MREGLPSLRVNHFFFLLFTKITNQFYVFVLLEKEEQEEKECFVYLRNNPIKLKSFNVQAVLVVIVQIVFSSIILLISCKIPFPILF